MGKMIEKATEYKASKEPQPDWVAPMLAKLSKKIFSDKHWIYERKLDGERCLVFKKGKEVTIMSRNRKDITNTYPEIVAAVKEQASENIIIDGEMVAFEGDITSFAELQKRMHLKDAQDIKNTKTAVFYYIFDILHYNNLKISELPQVQRKEVLQEVLDFKDPLRYTVHRFEDGIDFYKEACSKKWEGLIAKKAESSYTHGRSSNWLKLKCMNQQELIIGGYTEPAGSRIGFGALLLGYYEKGKLQYAGKVGTGFTDKILQDLLEKMTRIEIKSPEFEHPKQIKNKNVHWVKPELVAEMSFTEWTSGNKLRHPSFLGLRRDKDPREVVKES